jgi:alkylated DNA repair protein (DNA oxidative demethylase)
VIPTTLDLPLGNDPLDSRITPLGDGAVLLRGFALPADSLIRDARAVAAIAPFRQMQTPGGRHMSVAMTNCGPLGWVSDARGYRYEARDPTTGERWPDMPSSFSELAARAALTAGYAGFRPDACLINRYQPGTRLSLHQDKDELDFTQPIVSVSLGLPAVFLWGGATRSARPARVPVAHGDVVVFGGASRLVYHGIKELDEGEHADLGAHRMNLTFRVARQ